MIYFDLTTATESYTEEQILKLMKIFRNKPIDRIGLLETSTIIVNPLLYATDDFAPNLVYRETI